MWGVYKTRDGGGTWIAGSPPIAQVFSIAIDPKNSGTIYIGAFYGNRVGSLYKSTDGGASWTAMNAGLPDASVRAIAIDPQNTETLYAGMSGASGIFKSLDGGANWKQLNASWPQENTPVWSSVNSIAIDPENPLKLYVGTSTGVFRSTDAGVSWSALNSGLSAGGASVVLDLKDPNTVYAATNGGVFVITLSHDRRPVSRK
jgi:photosystem II stability/assembly factor-like uncharacterized protein